MDKEEILSKVKEILLDVKEENVDINTKISLIQSGFFDSLDWISFLTRIEEEFNIDIPADEANRYQIGVVDNLVHYLEIKLDE